MTPDWALGYVSQGGGKGKRKERTAKKQTSKREKKHTSIKPEKKNKCFQLRSIAKRSKWRKKRKKRNGEKKRKGVHPLSYSGDITKKEEEKKVINRSWKISAV